MQIYHFTKYIHDYSLSFSPIFSWISQYNFHQIHFKQIKYILILHQLRSCSCIFAIFIHYKYLLHQIQFHQLHLCFKKHLSNQFTFKKFKYILFFANYIYELSYPPITFILDSVYYNFHYTTPFSKLLKLRVTNYSWFDYRFLHTHFHIHNVLFAAVQSQYPDMVTIPIASPCFMGTQIMDFHPLTKHVSGQ